MGGISIPVASSALIAGVGSIVVYASTGGAQSGVGSASGIISGLDVQFRPPQWSKPALTMFTVPASYVQSSNTAASSTGAVTQNPPSSSTPPNASPQMLVFDAVMRASHSQRARPTLHPVQDSASITDHIILDPAHLVLDVIMTDVLQAYAPGQWVGNASKSISCFDTLDNLRAARVPLTVTTRLKTYTNMFIIDVLPEDTIKTFAGLRATVELQQIFLFSTSTQSVSARPQTTDSTTIGQTNPAPVPAGVTAQNSVPAPSTDVTSSGVNAGIQIPGQQGTTIGAGGWSSNNNGQLSVNSF